MSELVHCPAGYALWYKELITDSTKELFHREGGRKGCSQDFAKI